LPLLIRVLRHEDQQDTALVMSTIAAVGPTDKRAVIALLNEITRETKSLRETAVKMLTRMGRSHPSTLEVMLDRYLRDQRTGEVLLACGPATARALLGRVLESEAETREYYLALFSRLSQEPEAPVMVLDLAVHLRESDPIMSLAAMSALQRFGRLAEGALPELNALLQTAKEPAIISAVCTTMGTVGAQGLPALVRVLGSESEETRMSVITILEMLGPAAKPAAPTLQKLLKLEESGLMRYRIQSALQAMGY
jgi:HEAT repeat protein